MHGTSIQLKESKSRNTGIFAGMEDNTCVRGPTFLCKQTHESGSQHPSTRLSYEKRSHAHASAHSEEARKGQRPSTQAANCKDRSADPSMIVCDQQRLHSSGASVGWWAAEAIEPQTTAPFFVDALVTDQRSTLQLKHWRPASSYHLNVAVSEVNKVETIMLELPSFCRCLFCKAAVICQCG